MKKILGRSPRNTDMTDMTCRPWPKDYDIIQASAMATSSLFNECVRQAKIK